MKKHHPDYPDQLGIRYYLAQHFGCDNPLRRLPFGERKELVACEPSYLRWLLNQSWLMPNLRHGVWLALLQQGPENQFKLVVKEGGKERAIFLIWDNETREAVINAPES